MDDFTKSYTEDDLVVLAKKRIKIKRGLYNHISTYVFVNAFLIVIYYFTGGENTGDIPWFLYPLGFWGFGLLFHIYGTFEELQFKHNITAVNKEVEKLRKKLK